MIHRDPDDFPIGEEILRMSGITKVYGNGVLANENVNFSVKKGEIHAIMGENGAGKSTLMKILFGNEQPDRGEICFKGRTQTIESPKKAVELGIGMVYQHFNLAESLTVAENIVVGQEPGRGILFRQKSAYDAVEELARKYAFDIDPKSRVRDLSVGKKQKVEILKILYRNSELIILDEPTAVLTPQETEELFHQLLLLKQNGYTIIFISHKINEVKTICDRMTIIRAGKTRGTYEISELSANDISVLMVGRDVVQKIEKPAAKPGKTVLSARDLRYRNEHGAVMLDGVSFDLRQGEILGVAGVEGSGQRELAEAVSGMLRPEGGAVYLDGREITGKTPGEVRALGFSHIHEDRMTYGVAKNVSITENLIANRCASPELGGKAFFDGKKTSALAQKLVEEYQIVCKTPSVPAGMLSGGNIQKVVVAREMSVEPQVLLANQPTRGIDVGAVEFIHERLIRDSREKGCAVLLISSDLNEVLEMSDSLLVMYKGHISGYFADVSALTEQELGLYMLGLKRQSEQELKEALHEKV
ncbi:MAG: ABC transporter ATP-binding protein [Oscillospiraceae bacterium]|nr:ABC transporter ATP-binding protein [Oscillospiraceae bacterium]